MFAHRKNDAFCYCWLFNGVKGGFRRKNVTGDSESNHGERSLLMKSKNGVLKRKMRTCARLFCNYQHLK